MGRDPGIRYPGIAIPTRASYTVQNVPEPTNSEAQIGMFRRTETPIKRGPTGQRMSHSSIMACYLGLGTRLQQHIVTWGLYE